MQRITEAGETLDAEGATSIADAIRNYWLARGHIVRVWVEDVQNRFGVSLFHQVRSDLVNGRPRLSA